MRCFRFSIFSLAVSTCFLGGCGDRTAQTLVTGIGGIAGSLLGAQLGNGTGQQVAALVGGLAGGVAASSVYGFLSEEDGKRHEEAITEVLSQPDTTPIAWEHQGVKGIITPATLREGEDGSACRIFEERFHIQGTIKSNVKMGCRPTPESEWMITEV